MWMIENPSGGRAGAGRSAARVCAEGLQAVSGQVDFDAVGLDAVEELRNAFAGFNKPELDLEDPWQFKNFLWRMGDDGNW